MEETKNPALERAIDSAGGITKLATTLGLSGHAVINGWRNTRVPAEHCFSIERITGVKCEELRPDLEWSVVTNRSETPKEAA